MKNIFITGEKKVGKSTLLNRILNENNFDVMGFYTLPFYINSNIAGYYMHSIISLTCNDIPISAKLNVGCAGICEGFNLCGVESLSFSKPVAIMDELGFIEEKFNAIKFNALVREIILSSTHVLGVLRLQETEIFKFVKNNENSIIFHLTGDNVDEVYNDIVTLLSKW